MFLSSDGKCINQVDSRIFKCGKLYFSLNNVGMPYPGLPVDLKLHIWHTICRETVYLNRAMYGKLESLQARNIQDRNHNSSGGLGSKDCGCEHE